jgi:predicted MFS family arabinose efflux permease
MYGGLLLLPLYLQVIAARDTVETGFLLLAMGLGSALALPVGGALTDRFGAGRVTLAGALALLLSTLPFLLPTPLPALWLAPLLVVRGIGMALGQMPAMTAAYAAAHKEEMGDAATLVNIVQRVGGAIGAVLIVVLLAHADGAKGYFNAFVTLSIISALTMLLALVMMRLTARDEREAPAG